jgi:predicted MPP superfamily phosphohydrolase
MPLAHLPKSLEGKTLAHLSDLHMGPRVDDSYLLGVFDIVQKRSPDIVVYSGDFISLEPQILNRVKRMFPKLPQGRLGTFAVFGNHDYGKNWVDLELAEQLTRILSTNGVRVLHNELETVEGLQIIGMGDLWAKQFNPEIAFANFNRNAAAIALSHNPDTADLAILNSFQGWILSGHTHGGQCKPPFLPPPLLPVKNKSYTSGVFSLAGGGKMYISRGVGHLIRVRFNVRPEVTFFSLKSA